MKSIPRFVSLILIILTLCGFLGASASSNYVTILNPSGSDIVDAESNLKVEIAIGGEKPSFQQIALRDLTTDEKYISNESFTGNVYKISKKMLTPNHSYRVWVATFDGYGEKLAQDIVEFTAASYQTEYTCPFRGDYKSTSFVDMYWHCLTTGCFKDEPWLRESWENGWSLLGMGLENPLYSVIIELIQ